MRTRVPTLMAGLTGTILCTTFLSFDAIGGGCTPSTGPDVIVGQLNGVANYTNVGNIDAFAIGTDSCNIGSVNLLWQAETPNHPVIPQNVYRLRTVNGVAQFEHIGQGWMKHAFTALTQNLCCTCNGQGGSVLGIGCSDPYTATRNGTQLTTVGGLGPRFQVNAHAGAFIMPYAFRNNNGAVPVTSITRRVQIHIDDLNPALNPGAVYFGEAQYVTPDDATAQNQNNNASYRQLSVSGASPNFSLNLSNGGAAPNTPGGTQQQKPAIEAWKAIDPSVQLTTISTTESPNSGGDTTGKMILGAKATNLGNGTWAYEYALYNQNSDRCVQSFSVPAANNVVTNLGFHDVPYHSGDGYNSSPAAPVNFDGTDWPGAYASGAVTWTMVNATPVQNSNALRWATMYNFRFVSNQPPSTGTITMNYFKSPGVLNVNGVVVPTPGPVGGCDGDADNSGNVDVNDLLLVINNWGAAGTPGDVNNSGLVDVDDLLMVIGAWGACP